MTAFRNAESCPFGNGKVPPREGEIRATVEKTAAPKTNALKKIVAAVKSTRELLKTSPGFAADIESKIVKKQRNRSTLPSP